jgi:hypothetical protein
MLSRPLTGGRACKLLLLLGLAKGLKIMFYCSNFLDSLVLEGQVPAFMSPPPGTVWSSYTPWHWVPFPEPLTTRRVTVEVF